MTYRAWPSAAWVKRVARRLYSVPWRARSPARLTGRYQTQALLTLALTLAKREDAAFGGAHVDADGCLTGLDSNTSEPSPVILVATALQLCLTQFGRRETLQIVAEAWPDMRLR